MIDSAVSVKRFVQIVVLTLVVAVAGCIPPDTAKRFEFGDVVASVKVIGESRQPITQDAESIRSKAEAVARRAGFERFGYESTKTRSASTVKNWASYLEPGLDYTETSTTWETDGPAEHGFVKLTLRVTDQEGEVRRVTIRAGFPVIDESTGYPFSEADWVLAKKLTEFISSLRFSTEDVYFQRHPRVFTRQEDREALEAKYHFNVSLRAGRE